MFLLHQVVKKKCFNLENDQNIAGALISLEHKNSINESENDFSDQKIKSIVNDQQLAVKLLDNISNVFF